MQASSALVSENEESSRLLSLTRSAQSRLYRAICGLRALISGDERTEPVTRPHSTKDVSEASRVLKLDMSGDFTT